MKKILFTLLMFGMFFFASAQQPSRFGEKSDSTKTEDNQSVEEPSNLDYETVTNSSNVDASRSKPPKQKSSFMERARFGGMVGASFGSYTYIELSPRMHYLLQDNLAVGTGISYYYWKYRDAPRASQAYGMSFFSWYNPFSSLILQAEYEPLNFEVYKYDLNDGYYTDREWVQGLMLGGGIRQQAGRANIFFVVLYNVLYDPNRSFYGSPWVIRIGAGF